MKMLRGIFVFILFSLSIPLYSQNVFPATGKVGIGTTTPAENLSVEGNARFSQGIFISSIGYRLVNSMTDLTNNSTWYGMGRSNLILSGSPSTGPSVQLAGYYGLNLKTGSGNLVMLLNGNVGIGTLTPKEQLSVNGKIRSKEVTVEVSNWPDYVFQSNYNLPKLDSLQTEIKSLGHLPEIPSATEICRDGVNLGEMNKKLLEKIEQLTLYIVDLHKQLQIQKKDLEALQKRIDKNNFDVLTSKKFRKNMHNL